MMDQARLLEEGRPEILAPQATKGTEACALETRKDVDPSKKYQIDEYFDVAEVSELAHGERSAFKRVYSMNRW